MTAAFNTTTDAPSGAIDFVGRALALQAEVDRLHAQRRHLTGVLLQVRRTGGTHIPIATVLEAIDEPTDRSHQ